MVERMVTPWLRQRVGRVLTRRMLSNLGKKTRLRYSAKPIRRVKTRPTNRLNHGYQLQSTQPRHLVKISVFGEQWQLIADA